MLRGWRLRARWPAPIHPELAAHLRAGVSCSYFKLCAARLDRFVTREKKRLREAPAARGERGAKASADGARRTSPGRRAGQAAIRAGLDKTAMGEGGRSRSEGGPVTIYFDRPPPPPEVGRDVRKGGRSRSVSRPPPFQGGAGQSVSRPAPPDIATGPLPRSDNFI